MKSEATLQSSLRRVGAMEGFAHILGGAALFAFLGRAFEPEVALAAPAAAGVLWVGWYSALRAARVREWFGVWDAVSFTFVSAYAVALACATLWLWR